jgi:PTH1 family peptidyl-tRNA hydrolase
VKYWLDKLKIPPPQLLVIVDELALPLSKLRLKPSGSDGGHNGLKSVEEALGSRDYPRLRFGIGNHYSRGKQSDYVLGKWKTDEEPLVSLKIERAVEVIENFVSVGIVQAMNEINNKEFSL